MITWLLLLLLLLMMMMMMEVVTYISPSHALYLCSSLDSIQFQRPKLPSRNRPDAQQRQGHVRRGQCPLRDRRAGHATTVPKQHARRCGEPITLDSRDGARGNALGRGSLVVAPNHGGYIEQTGTGRTVSRTIAIDIVMEREGT